MAGVCGVKILLLWSALVFTANCQNDTAPVTGSPAPAPAPTPQPTVAPIDVKTTSKPDVFNTNCSFTVTPVDFGLLVKITSLVNGTNFTTIINETMTNDYLDLNHQLGENEVTGLKPCTEYEVIVIATHSPKTCNFGPQRVRTKEMTKVQITFNAALCRRRPYCFDTKWNIRDQVQELSEDDICTDKNVNFHWDNCSDFTVTEYIGVDVYPTIRPQTNEAAYDSIKKLSKCSLKEDFFCSIGNSTEKNLKPDLKPFTNYSCTAHFKDQRNSSLVLTGIPYRNDCDFQLNETTKTNTSVHLSWKMAPECANSSEISFRCSCERALDKKVVEETSVWNVSECTITGLTPFTDYTCKIQPLYNNTPVDITEQINVKTEPGVPGHVTGITVTLLKHDEIETACRGPPSFFGKKTIYKAKLNGPKPFQEKESDNCKFKFDNLEYPADYTLQIFTFNGDFRGEVTSFPFVTFDLPNVTEIKRTYHQNNNVTITCNYVKSFPKEEISYMATLIGPTGDPKFPKSKTCSFTFDNLDYNSKYQVQLFTTAGNRKRLAETTSFHTHYNDKAIIGVLIFFIILILLALLFVSYKIYQLKRTKSQSLNEKICLIPLANEEENLRLIDPIPAEMLLETYKMKAADEARLFLAEFQSIPRIFSRYSVKEAKKNMNAPKNRYIDILPYDYNRVQLTTGNGEAGCDYINASFIDGFKELKKYIAAQGPKEESVGDFWRMIWEQKSSIIVMVTRCEEGKRPKCLQYWPSLQQEMETYEEFEVKIKSEDLCPNYIIRHLSLANKKEKVAEREVTHIQFISWPDHGVPTDPHLLLKLRRRVNAFKNFFSGPIVVHCSAGVGRTGTYISIDAMMESLEAEGQVDIFGFVVTLRKQRCLMVQVEGQYTLIHQALLEHTLFGDTEISVSELHSAVTTLKRRSSDLEPTLMEEEFERLANYKNWRTTNTGMTEENKKKNRSMTVLPYDFNRVLVKPNEGVISNKEHDDEDDDDSSTEEEEEEHSARYINASYINGYWGPRSFIATQTPIPETIADFWLMVYQNNASMVVMFSDTREDGKESDFIYWDHDNKAYGDIEVEMTSTKTYPAFISRNALIRHIKRKESRPVKHVQFLNWKSGELPESPQVLMDFMKEVRSSSGSSKSLSTNPVVVHCNDGSSCSGIFCALWNLLDSEESEKVVDVFQVSKTLCKERQGLISSLTQYQFLYDALETLYPIQNGSVKAELEAELVQIVDETKATEPPKSATVDCEEVKEEVKEGSEPEPSTPLVSGPLEEAGNSTMVTVEL